MASGTTLIQPQAEAPPAPGRYGDFIEKRLEHTRHQVRLVDVASSLMLLTAGSLVFFLAIAVLDHWVFSHGLSFLARLGLFCTWLAGSGVFMWRFLVPSLLNRINPVFAAQTIEQTRPTLKNSLINFLLLRSHQDDVAPVVYRAMEHRAAADLLKVPVDHAVERGRIVHLACMLAAVVGVFALYLALSPKNPLTSMARVLLPFSNVSVPTRVHIEEVKPGSDVVFNEERQEITAHVSGLRDGEEVVLLATTTDNQAVEDRVVMTRTDDADHYRCELPAGGGGFQQDTFYRITAGDATTQTYKLEVQTAPTIGVDRVDYRYPAYTGKADRSVKNQGDIKGLEGTQVTIYATANMEISQASIDLNCEGLRLRTMKINGKKAIGQFTLPAYVDNEARSPLERYQIKFTDTGGHEARRPVRYNVEVDRDLPPDIEIVEPHQEGTVNVPLDGQLTIRVRALDPDYALRRITLHGAINDSEIDLRGSLLERPKPDEAVVGSFEGKYTFSPAKLHLKEGDEVRYWATAADNKEPQFNLSDTRNTERKPRTIHIVGKGQSGQQDRSEQAQNGGGNGEQGDGASKQGDGAKGKPGSGAGDPSKGDNSAANNGQGGQKGDGREEHSPSDKGRKGGKDRTQPDKAAGSGTDQGTEKSGEPSAGDESNPPSKRKDPVAQRTEAMKDIIKDAEGQNKNQPNQPGQSPDNPSKGDPSQSQKPENQGKDPGQQGGGKPSGQPQGGPQQPGGQKPNQSGQSPKGGQSGDPSSGQSGNDKTQSGKPDPSQGNPSESPNGANRPTPDGQTGSNDSAGKKPSPEQPGKSEGNPSQNNSSKNDPSKSDPSKNNAAQKDPSGGTSDAGSQPKGDKHQTPGQQPQPGGQSGSSNQGEKSDAPKSADGSKDGQSASGQPKSEQKQTGGKPGQPGENKAGKSKPDSNQAGGKPEQTGQSAGGDASPKKQPSAGQDGKSQSANGSTPPNSKTQKPGGQGGGQEEQIAQGPKPGEKKPGEKMQPGSGSSPLPGEKPGSKPKPESGNSQGGGQGSQGKKDTKPQDGGGASGGGDKPKEGQGNEPGSSGGEKPGGKKPSTKPGGMSDNDGSQQKDPGKNGDPTSRDSTGAPDSQGEQSGNHKAGDSKPGLDPNANSAQSPSTSSHDSSTSSDSPGDRKGGGGEGGGQKDTKKGKGAAGTGQSADSGGSASNDRGTSATGKRSGQDVRAPESKGSNQHEEGPGSGQSHESAKTQSGKTQSANDQKPSSDSSNDAANSQNQAGGGNSGDPASQPAGNQGSGQPAGGSQAGTRGNPTISQHEPEGGPDAADLDFSKKQVDLALNHLKDQMASQKPELLDKLGWTKEEAQKFIDNLNKLKDSAQKPGSEGEKGKQAYNEFLKNLDLHPHNTRIEGGKTKVDDLRARDSGQMEVPSEYAEEYHAYSRSTAGQK
jgi:collagen type III alpha